MPSYSRKMHHSKKKTLAKFVFRGLFFQGLVLFLLLLARGTALSGWTVDAQGETGEKDTAAQDQPHGDTAGSQKPSLSPGEWALGFGLDGQLFPSAIIALSTLHPEDIGVQREAHTFGSPLAMASVFIRGKQAGDSVTVEISSTKLIHPSKMTVELPDADTVYEISPHLKYAYEQLLAVRQPYPEDVTAKVFLNGQDAGEKTQTIIVRPLNDCFYGMVSDDGRDFQDWSEMFAAYVNESDPLIEDILGEALRKGYIESFIGYQGDQNTVIKQMKAIWRVLKERGIKYSDITTTAVQSGTVVAQHVRLIGDSTREGQANCVDGSVLFASIFRKIGLDAYLVLLPHHMMVAVSTEASEDSPVIPLETTLLAEASLSQARDSAEKSIAQYGRSSKKEASKVIYISVNAARDAGILPLRDVSGQPVQRAEK